MVRIEVEENDNSVIVRIAGELTLYNTGEFEKVFKKYLSTKPVVVALDLGGMDFLDSFGISRIVKVSRSFTGIADFILLNVSNNVLDVFRMATFDRIFIIMKEDEFREKYLPQKME